MSVYGVYTDHCDGITVVTEDSTHNFSGVGAIKALAKAGASKLDTVVVPEETTDLEIKALRDSFKKVYRRM